MAIYAGFVLLAGILLWLLAAARGPWQVKLVLIVTVPTFGVAVWHALGTFKGYPVPHAPPPEAILLASVVKEPAPGQPGAIYLWLVPTATGSANPLAYRSDGEPRAYVVPYTRQLHEQAQTARRLAASGRRVLLRRGGTGQPIPAGHYRAYPQPAPAPPMKGAP
jgi:hypothetical protein